MYVQLPAMVAGSAGFRAEPEAVGPEPADVAVPVALAVLVALREA
jgi:hypothetical protein